jgi:two-component system, OmpR family, phosphate regulon sensor histidine kinase PhoR
MTLRSSIFRKFLAGAVLVIGVTVSALDFYLTRYTTRREVARVEQQLETSARILAAEIPALPRESLEDWSKSAGARAGARVTFITPSGVVLADSQHDPESMENHAGRPEVREAVSRGVGSSIRHSQTLDRDLCYLAVSLRYAPKRGQPEQADYVLRLAVPIEDVEAAVGAVERRILWASLAAALLALAISYGFARSFTRRIDRLRAFAEKLGDRQATEDLPAAADDELGLLAASLNRTSRQLRELVDRLHLESSRREAILASMVEGVLAVNQDLRVTFSNRAFLQALGRTGPVAENTPLVECIRDLDLRDLLARVVSTGQPEKKRLQIASAEGRAFEVQATPLAVPAERGEAAGQPRGALALLHDITDLERLERVRSDFVANVSHELRTPLTAIQGYAETLLEGGLEDAENNRKFLEIIKAHSIRLNNIASDLLTLSELESVRQQTGEAQPVSVRAAVETALRTVEPEALLREVRLVREKAEDGLVRGDRTRLEQAFINLLSNAVKFNRAGGEARVSAERIGDRQIRIVVADNGIGIPSADLPRIFERFYRVDKARSRELGGTGLGLSIVKHVIERMGGSVSVASQLGKGSTFSVLLPLEEDSPSLLV